MTAPPARPTPVVVPPAEVMEAIVNGPVAVKLTAPPAASGAPVVLIESVVITLPVAVSDNRELTAPIAPLMKIPPVPAESVSERVPAVCWSAASRR